jgi:hypothetical protein
MFEGETVTILTAASTGDPYSGQSDEPDWEHATELDVVTLAPAEPRPSEEPTADARNAVVSGWTLYLPLGTPVDAYAKVRVRGREYDVLGTPAAWYDQGLVVQTSEEVG